MLITILSKQLSLYLSIITVLFVVLLGTVIATVVSVARCPPPTSRRSPKKYSFRSIGVCRPTQEMKLDSNLGYFVLLFAELLIITEAGKA